MKTDKLNGEGGYLVSNWTKRSLRLIQKYVSEDKTRQFQNILFTFQESDISSFSIFFEQIFIEHWHFLFGLTQITLYS